MQRLVGLTRIKAASRQPGDTVEMTIFDSVDGQSAGPLENPSMKTPELRRAADRTFLAALPGEVLARLLQGANLNEFAKGQTLFRAGDPAPTLNLLVEGYVELTSKGSPGPEGVFAVLHPVTAMAPGAPLGNLRYRFNARAVDRARLLSLPASVFRQELAVNCRLARQVVDLLAHQESVLADEILQLRLSTTVERLASYLLSLAQAEDGVVVLPYEKKVLAARLGMKPESLSRAFAELRPLVVALVGRRIRICDPDALRAYSPVPARLRSPGR